METRQKKTIIIGAGAAGLFAARELQKNGIEPLLLEKSNRIGGKCLTYQDLSIRGLMTEEGAVYMTPNYGVVIEAAYEKGIKLENALPSQMSKMSVYQEMMRIPWFQRPLYVAQFAGELVRFTTATYRFQQLRDKLQPLPSGYELPFATFAKEYHLTKVNEFLKPFVTGFGYGPMEKIPTHEVMAYIGLGTVPSILAKPFISSVSVVQGGYQPFMEKIAKDFNVICSAHVNHIKRTDKNVTVTYTTNAGNTASMTADTLLLAIPPLQWPHLGMALSDVEQECVAAQSFYRYPIAICKLKGIPPQYRFVPEANEVHGTGRVALITTHDMREDPEDGRLCTVYINLPQGKNNFSLEPNSPAYCQLKKELEAMPGVTAVSILKTNIWEDYMPSLPWKLRLKLEGEQMKQNTLYAGAYTVKGFESVACVAEDATNTVKQYLQHQEIKQSIVSQAFSETKRAVKYFAMHQSPNTNTQNKDSKTGYIISGLATVSILSYLASRGKKPFSSASSSEAKTQENNTAKPKIALRASPAIVRSNIKPTIVLPWQMYQTRQLPPATKKSLSASVRLFAPPAMRLATAANALPKVRPMMSMILK